MDHKIMREEDGLSLPSSRGVDERVWLKPCCDSFKESLEAGTDNENYGPVTWVYLDSGDLVVEMGSGLDPIKFCPWCGQGTQFLHGRPARPPVEMFKKSRYVVVLEGGEVMECVFDGEVLRHVLNSSTSLDPSDRRIKQMRDLG